MKYRINYCYLVWLLKTEDRNQCRKFKLWPAIIHVPGNMWLEDPHTMEQASYSL